MGLSLGGLSCTHVCEEEEVEDERCCMAFWLAPKTVKGFLLHATPFALCSGGCRYSGCIVYYQLFNCFT